MFEQISACVCQLSAYNDWKNELSNRHPRKNVKCSPSKSAKESQKKILKHGGPERYPT